MGQIHNIISGLSDDGKTEADDFFKTVRDAIESGNYNAEELAANAPDELKTAAEENGVNLTDLISDMADHYNEMKDKFSYMPPPPNGTAQQNTNMEALKDLISGLSDDGKTEAKDFFKTVRDAIESGNYNAEELAKNAPDELKTAAEENGVNLTDLINDMADQYNEMKDRFSEMPPPPPPPEESSSSNTLQYSNNSLLEILNQN
jgi:hypothetical protein